MNEQYASLYNKIETLVDPGLPLISNLANVSSILYGLYDVNWAGFYLSNNAFLFLGPFQGDVGCLMINFNEGVCGAAYSQKKTVIVDNVHEFPGHIACSGKTNSEIVTPIIVNDVVMGVIDIDSPVYSRFGDNEKELLEEVAKLLADTCFKEKNPFGILFIHR